jgi:hypothetical protein
MSEIAERARQARNASALARKRGRLAPLGINPATGKRWINTGRSPVSGTRSPLLDPNAPLPAVDLSHRFRSRRERAAELREKMARHSAIFNGAWLLRDSFFSSDARRQQMAEALIRTFAQELKGCADAADAEACLYALADAVTCGSHGVPWEA